MNNKRYTESELDINEFMGYAAEHIGEVHELQFQSFSKRSEYAGKFEILDFEKAENPQFTYDYWKYRDEKTPSGADIGYYKIRITDSKFYSGKTFWFPVSAYLQYQDPNTGKVYKSKELFISNAPRETNKRLKAYEFGIIDWNVRWARG